MPALYIYSLKPVMNSTVFSYVYNLSDFQDMPREYRQHTIANINDASAITEQVKADRGDVSTDLFLGWVR